MRAKFIIWTGLVLVVALFFSIRPVAQDTGVRALYDRAESLNRRTQTVKSSYSTRPSA